MTGQKGAALNRTPCHPPNQLPLPVRASSAGKGAGSYLLAANDEIKKKRPELSPGRLGSPPPELPNHSWIVENNAMPVNVTSVIEFVCPLG